MMNIRKSWIFFGHSDWFDDLRGLINKPHQWVQGDDRHCEGRKIGSTRFPYFHHFFQAFLISGRRFLGENSSDLFMIFQNDGKCRLKPSFTGTALFVFFWFQWFKNRFFKAFSNCPGCWIEWTLLYLLSISSSGCAYIHMDIPNLWGLWDGHITKTEWKLPGLENHRKTIGKP